MCRFPPQGSNPDAVVDALDAAAKLASLKLSS
jgi:hypothetical protein